MLKLLIPWLLQQHLNIHKSISFHLEFPIIDNKDGQIASNNGQTSKSWQWRYTLNKKEINKQHFAMGTFPLMMQLMTKNLQSFFVFSLLSPSKILMTHNFFFFFFFLFHEIRSFEYLYKYKLCYLPNIENIVFKSLVVWLISNF